MPSPHEPLPPIQPNVPTQDPWGMSAGFTYEGAPDSSPANQQPVDYWGNQASVPPLPGAAIDQAAQQYLPVEQAPGRLPQLVQKYGARLALVGTLTGVIGGGAALAAEHGLSGNKPHAATAHLELPNEQAEHLAQTEQLITVSKDFKRALAVDECQTKVTAEDATSTYRRLFEQPSLTHVSDEQLAQEVTRTTEALQASHDKLTFAAMTESEKQQYDRLQQAADNGDKVFSIQQYQELLSNYASRLGLTVVYGWDAAGHDSQTNSDVAPFMSSITPVSEEQMQDSFTARRAMIRAIEDLSLMPKEALEMSDTEAIIMGNLTDPDALGQVNLNSGKAIMLDITDLDKMSHDDQLANEPIVKVGTAHEETHLIDSAICGPILQSAANSGEAYGDPAWRALNPKGFAYSKNTEHAMVVAAGGRITSLDLAGNNPNSQVVIARAYGADTDLEDVATAVGEKIVYTKAATDLYESKADMHVLREKEALMIARITAIDPKLGEFYKTLLVAAHAQAEVDARKTKAAATVDQLATTKVQDAQGNYVGTPQTAAANKRLANLQALTAKYDNILMATVWAR